VWCPKHAPSVPSRVAAQFSSLRGTADDTDDDVDNKTDKAPGKQVCALSGLKHPAHRHLL
jgi:hypothetical protein